MLHEIVGIDEGPSGRGTPTVTVSRSILRILCDAPMVHLGAANLLVLSGRTRYTQEPLVSTLEPGTWGYIPANSRVEGVTVEADTELLVSFHGPVAFLGTDGRSVRSILTSLDRLRPLRIRP